MAMTALKVTPSQLKTKSGEFSKDASNVKKTSQEMFSLIKELNGAVWSGDAATAYKTQFNKLEDDTNRMVKMIQEFSTDLTKIADAYIKAENANEAASKSLKTEVVTY